MKYKTCMGGKRIREERFLLLMPEYTWGGAETQFRLFIDFAEKHKCCLDVIVEHRLQPADSVLRKDILGMKNVRFYELDEYGVSDEKLMLDITKCILKNLIWIKYKSCLIQYTPDLRMAPILNLLNIRVVYSERNDAALIEKNKLYFRDLKYCKYITANSKYAQTVLERMTGREVYFIRNGKTVTDSFAAKDNKEIHNILVPGRIFPVKNQLIVLNYIKESINFQGKVVFAGRVEDKNYYKKLKYFVHSNHLEDKVEFLGQVEDMRKLYQEADLVILPSFVEGTPNVVLESYMYGRPVIVSDTNTVRDVVRNPELRFSLKNIGGIAQCINYVRSLSTEKYEYMLQKNREYVITNYAVDKMAMKYLKLLI